MRFVDWLRDGQGESVEGRFACDECSGFTEIAKYYSAEEKLVYLCPNGHENTLTGYKL